MTPIQDSTASPITRIILVRHGQSVANAGGIPPDHITNPLTDAGHAQAKAFADSFAENITGTPTLFIHSPYLRTRQTAEPTLQRFPDVPVEQWPIHEFTFLEPARHNGTTETQQLPHIEAYWKREDPAHIEGPGAESFSLFLGRARDAIKRLARISTGGFIVVFTHGLMMQAFRLLLLFPHATDAVLMANFRRFHLANFVQNTEPLELEAASGQLRLVGQPSLNLFALQGETSDT